MDRYTNRIKAAPPLPSDDVSHKTVWSICINSCMRHGGNWMAQTLEHILKNWLVITLGWLYLSSQALHGARPIFILDTYIVLGTAGVELACTSRMLTLLKFACAPIP